VAVAQSSPVWFNAKIESLATKRGGAKKLSDEIEQKEELPKEEIPIPLYFDRYVVSELRSLGNQIVGLKGSMDERFVQVDRRFTELKGSMDGRFIQVEKRMDERFVQVDRRFVELKESIDERFVQFDKRVDERFARVDERIDNLDERINNLKESVDKLGANIKWIIGLSSPVIVGILAIIVKMFFGP
jgi:tetrahydromethanopterin S-methyltransferase subunit G